MADMGLCMGESEDLGDVAPGGLLVAATPMDALRYLAGDQLFVVDKLCPVEDSATSEPATEGAFCEEDCRKKRCVDRYDSSESSDSGVAVLSCTDCSGSSTASSDITDPGSPFSTASSHSEDSALQPSSKMPPTQSAHHPPWPWSGAEECSPVTKRSIQIEKTVFPKRLKSDSDSITSKQSPPCLSVSTPKTPADTPVVPSPNGNKFINVKKASKKQLPEAPKQGKITEYFKSQIKVHVIKKDTLDQQTQFNGGRGPPARTPRKEIAKARKVTIPRKILPAPSKLPLPTHHPHNLVTLTAVTFPPNLTYLHTKAPKPPDANIFVPTIPCLNVIHQPVQKLNFNCVKLNATVVPIVKLNALPSRLSVDTAVPTVLSAKPKGEFGMAPKPDGAACRSEAEEKAPSPSADSDSGVSSFKEHLEVVPPALKSPILSQPKTIRFPPAKQDVKEEVKEGKGLHAQESGLCKWDECTAQFDTSGALLEHLQVKHVISQATQEHYVCLWLGCKVHGRTSCSRSWLERHVLAHAGTKPFRCIVDGCGQRFNSQLTLERHVNGHFTGDGSQNNSTKKTTDTSSSKLFKRNGKKIRFRRQPWSARMFDFIDSGIMEGLQHKLLTMTQDRTMGQMHNTGDTMDVSSTVVARRIEADGRVKFLVRWHPSDIIPDEWVCEKELVSSKSVAIPSLKPSGKDALKARLFPPEESRKRRRKPISKQQT